MNDAWRGVLGSVAPTIATLLGGPLAGTAVAALSKTLLNKEGGTVEELAPLIQQANPETLLKIKEAEKDLKLGLANAGIRLEELHVQDTTSARTRDVEVRKLAGGNNERANWMIVGDIIGLVACLIVLIFFRKDLPGEVVGILSTITGIFGACLRDAHQFEFGSSRGSKEKDELLSKIAQEP